CLPQSCSCISSRRCATTFSNATTCSHVWCGADALHTSGAEVRLSPKADIRTAASNSDFQAIIAASTRMAAGPDREGMGDEAVRAVETFPSTVSADFAFVIGHGLRRRRPVCAIWRPGRYATGRHKKDGDAGVGQDGQRESVQV